MESIDNAGHAVLYSYGHFLDSLLLNIYNITKDFVPINKLSNSIEIQVVQKEHVLIYDLIDTENKTQSKILVAFSAICKEVDYLRNELENVFLSNILHYEEEAFEEMTVEEVHTLFAEFLPQLLDILIFVRRCRQVLLHFLKQMFAAVQYPWPKDAQNIMHLKLQEVFVYFGDLLLLFVALDMAFNFNEENNIAKHLNSFWQYIRVSSRDRGKISKVLADVNDELLTGNIFQVTLHFLFEEKVFLVNCSDFPTHFNKYLKKKLIELENAKENDISALHNWGRIAVSHVFMTKCFGITDKKIHRSVLELAKKFIAVPLFGDLVWIPGTFLSTHFEARGKMEINNKSISNSSFFHQRRLELIENNSSRDIKTFSFSVYKWALQMENLMSLDASFSNMNEDMAQLCIEGLFLSEQIKFCINNILQLHGTSGRPMTKMAVLNMCKLIELVKGVHSVFCRHHFEIAKQMNHTIQKRIMQILSTILRIKNSNVFKSGLQEKYIDSYSSLLLTEKILYGSCTKDRILIMRLALTVINHHPLLDFEAIEYIHKVINELHELCSLCEKLEKITSVNFLFMEENILPVYFKHIADSHSAALRLQYLLHAMPNDQHRVEYEKQRKDLLQHKVIKKLCEEIEVHLRLHAHAHLKEDASLEKISKNYLGLLCETPFGVYNWFITVRGLVESYLDETFYDLTTVALHDWQSYSEMRSLAAHQFKLESIEDNLPSQTISQGLDVLEIMRNIHVFVSKYLYNLNTQCFVEYTSANKHLNTIRIHQIANSIWTHGTGIMNTTVNFIYQFLRKKLLLCSQFLYDEHINSRLTKDLKFFIKQKSQKHALYPYERAEKFNKGISRLKLSTDGLSYLDQYRNLISQIGNALGYVRMIRSGGLHYSIATVTYFPLMDYVNILEKPREHPLSTVYESFENTFFNALHHLNVEMDALKLLVEVFRSVFHSPENDHLRLFVMIIPPLTINFVHYIVTSKEKMSKRNSVTGLFTDDGFAMGIAYLLSVFNLNEEFDSLHWFKSVYEKYDSEINKLFEIREIPSKDDSTHDNTVQLSIKRLQMYKQEFELLQYNLSSAKVFFSGENKKKDIS